MASFLRTKKYFILITTFIFVVSFFAFFLSTPPVSAVTSRGCGYSFQGGAFPYSDPHFTSFGAPYNFFLGNTLATLSIYCIRGNYIFVAGNGNANTYVWHRGYITRLTPEYEAYLLARSGFNRQFYYESYHDYLLDHCALPYENNYFNITPAGRQYHGVDLSKYYWASPAWKRDCEHIVKFRWQPFDFGGGQEVDGWRVGAVRAQLREQIGGLPFYPESDPTFFLAYICYDSGDGWKCGCRKKNTCDATGKWQIQKIP